VTGDLAAVPVVTYVCCRAWPITPIAPIGRCGYCHSEPRFVLAEQG
jgi:hypothetical protein